MRQIPQMIGYSRVSTEKQSLTLQNDSLKAEGCEKLFSDIATGKTAKRPGLEKCLEYLRPGDTLVVWKSDRLGRSTIDLLNIVNMLKEKGVSFKSLTENLLDTTTPNGMLVFGIFAILAQHERDRIQERTQAGLKAARARGRNGGRPSVMTEEKKQIAFKALQNQEARVRDVAHAIGVGIATVYRYQRELRDKGLLKWNNY